MIKREHRYGSLVFDRDAIVRAALRAYLEAIIKHSRNRRLSLSFTACDNPGWTGDLKRGAFYNGDLEGNHDVVAWTEAGTVGLAYELGFGPIEQLGLSVDAVTRGPDDVRGALPDLPDELEPALVMATRMLGEGNHWERLAGVGFWLYRERVAGTLFDDPTACGANRLAMWGLLRRGRLLPLIHRSSHPDTRATLAECDRKEGPIHALMDAVVDRALKGPTEFMTEELETLLHPAPDPEDLLGAHRSLQKVGITWPGSPELPKPPRRPRGRNPFMPTPPTTPPSVEPRHLGCLVFDRDAIVRAALRAYFENILAWLDPLERHPFAASFVPHWMGDLKRGAFFNGDGRGSYGSFHTRSCLRPTSISQHSVRAEAEDVGRDGGGAGRAACGDLASVPGAISGRRDRSRLQSLSLLRARAGNLRVRRSARA